jgi:dihydrofolate synthase / folylpolyglutamate synthase
LQERLAGLGVATDAILRYEDPGAAYRAAREIATEADRILVFGSFLTVAAALAQVSGRNA